MGFFDKIGLKKKETLDKGVEKSREGILNKLGGLLSAKTEWMMKLWMNWKRS